MPQAPNMNSLNPFDLLARLDGQIRDLQNINQNINPQVNPQLNINNNADMEFSSVAEEEVVRGWYQQQMMAFTYDLPKSKDENQFLSEEQGVKIIKNNQSYDFGVVGLFSKEGVRCTAAFPLDKGDMDSIEIQVNFFGTIDFGAMSADMEKGGPGQESLKQHELQLLKNLNQLIQDMNEKYPGKEITLKIAGHSLGGALAKGFTHSVQKAIAIANESNNPDGKSASEAIVEKIQKNGTIDSEEHKEKFTQLKAQLDEDEQSFKDLSALKGIKHVTTYANGAPGVSTETDVKATLMSYYYEEDFLDVYHHYDKKDITPTFGESEFLSGQHGIPPNVKVNKAIEYDIPLTEDDIRQSDALPFPGMTKAVMAAHNKKVFETDLHDVKPKVMDLKNADFLLEKAVFSKLHILIYKIIFSIAKMLVSQGVLNQKSGQLLYSLPTKEIKEDKVKVNETKVFKAKMKQNKQDVDEKLKGHVDEQLQEPDKKDFKI